MRGIRHEKVSKMADQQRIVTISICFVSRADQTTAARYKEEVTGSD